MTPIICIAAGSGIAPFRGFIQERAALIQSGQDLAPALLYFGCRGPEIDDLYREDFDSWQGIGAVDIRRAFSRADSNSFSTKEAKGCRHVQDRLLLDKNDISEFWNQGATVFVCGSHAVEDSVKQALSTIILGVSASREKAVDDVATNEWFKTVRNTRYFADIFD